MYDISNFYQIRRSYSFSHDARCFRLFFHLVWSPSSHNVTFIYLEFQSDWGKGLYGSGYLHAPSRTGGILILCEPFLSGILTRKIILEKQLAFVAIAHARCKRSLIKINDAHSPFISVWGRGLFQCMCGHVSTCEREREPRQKKCFTKLYIVNSSEPLKER